MKNIFLVSTLIILMCVLIGCQKAPTTNDEEYSKLTIETIKELSQKGEDLTWDDFKDYKGTSIGSGLYILKYDIDDEYCLLIGGGSMEEKPMYIYLKKVSDSEQHIDIRTDDISDFIE